MLYERGQTGLRLVFVQSVKDGRMEVKPGEMMDDRRE